MLRKATFLVVFILFSTAAFAQSVEITPTIGYYFGGDLDDVVSGDTAGKLNLGDGEAYGISADFVAREGWGIEFLWMRQGSDLDGNDDFFDDKADATVNTFHVGCIYQFRRGTALQPFVVGTLGASQLKSGGQTHNGFSYAAGGGVKFFFGNHFGARLQGNLANTHYGSSDEFVCNGGACYGLSDTNNVFQFQAQAGLIFKF